MIIGFSKPRKFSIFSWAITKIIRANFSHTFMCVYFPNINSHLVIEANRHGINAISLNKWLEKNEMVESVVMEDQTIVDRAFKYAIENLHVKYSTLTIIAIALGIRFKDGSRRMICSEFIARALRLDVKNVDQINPKELLERLKK